MRKALMLELVVTGSLLFQSVVAAETKKPLMFNATQRWSDTPQAIKPLVLQVDGQNRVVETHAFQLTGDNTIVKTANGRWKLTTSFMPVAEHNDAVDAEFTWTLIEGAATSTAVAVACDFEGWSSQNIVFAPASVYNGDRFDVFL